MDTKSLKNAWNSSFMQGCCLGVLWCLYWSRTAYTEWGFRAIAVISFIWHHNENSCIKTGYVKMCWLFRSRDQPNPSMLAIIIQLGPQHTSDYWDSFYDTCYLPWSRWRRKWHWVNYELLSGDSHRIQVPSKTAW